MAEIEAVKKIVSYLNPDVRRDIKILALESLMGLTTGDSNLALLSQLEDELPYQLLNLMKNDPEESIAKNSGLALINLSSSPSMAKQIIFGKKYEIVKEIWQVIKEKAPSVSGPACMILSNLTINEECSLRLLKDMEKNEITIENIVDTFSKGKDHCHYLGPVLSNLSQIASVRSSLIDADKNLLSKILPYIDYPDSIVRRGGIIGTIRNLSFDTSSHPYLLSEDVDVLSRLLLPLAGPTPEELEPEEIEKLPLDLQYLNDDKTIEADPDLQKMLLETLVQFCSTKYGREYIRSKNVYCILKEYHKRNDVEPAVKLACENVVDIIIKKEEEINLDNYKEVNVPDDVVPELEAMDKEYLKS